MAKPVGLPVPMLHPNCDKTFAPVMKFLPLWTPLTLTAKHNLEVHQMDIKAAYLNGILEEEIYLKPLTGSKPRDSKVW